MNQSSWHGNEMQGIIRTLAVKCAPILACPKDDRKTAKETACHEMVLGAVWALCEFSQPLNQQNQSDVSFRALHNVMKQLYRKTDAF